MAMIRVKSHNTHHNQPTLSKKKAVKSITAFYSVTIIEVLFISFFAKHQAAKSKQTNRCRLRDLNGEYAGSTGNTAAA